MVRKDEVRTAALEIKCRTQVVLRDRRALDMPTGASTAKSGLPRRLPRSLGLPEQTVERVTLAWSVGVAAALAEDRKHRVAVKAGDIAKRGVGMDVEVQVAVDLVGGACLLQVLDHVDYQRDRLDGAYIHVG